MRKPSKISFWMLIFLALLLAASCAPIGENVVVLPVDQNLLQVAPTATLSPTPGGPTLTVLPSSCDRAQLIADVTIPVGTQMPPGQAFTKTWRLRNIGNCTWTTSYQVVFLDGEQMSAPTSVSVPSSVAPGQEIDISINMIAPSATGPHRGLWIFKNANGQSFGVGQAGNEPLLVEINVVDVSPTSTSADTPSPSPTSTDTPSPTPTPTPTNTSTPTPDLIDEQAVKLARELAPQFSQVFGVQFDPSLAKGLDAARIGGQAGQLAGMIAPVINENQQYRDRNNEVREVEGIFSLNDSRLSLETTIIINKGNIQYPLLPLGAYMLACHSQRQNDCLAISLQGVEFQIKPESVSLTIIDPVSPPTVAYEEGSIRKCFRVLRRKICIRVFR